MFAHGPSFILASYSAGTESSPLPLHTSQFGSTATSAVVPVTLFSLMLSLSLTTLRKVVLFGWARPARPPLLPRVQEGKPHGLVLSGNDATMRGERHCQGSEQERDASADREDRVDVASTRDRETGRRDCR